MNHSALAVNAKAAQAIVEEFGADRVLTTLKPYLSEARAQRLREVVESRLSGVTVVIEDPYDPHNISAAVRSMEAFGLLAISVIPVQVPIQLDESIASGAHKWIDIVRHSSAETAFQWLEGRGFRSAATLPQAEYSIDEIDVEKPIAIWFGNEHEGLTQRTISRCATQVTIPMVGFTQSLNLSVSVALCVREMARRRRLALGKNGDLSESERQALMARYMIQSVREPRRLLEHMSK